MFNFTYTPLSISVKGKVPHTRSFLPGQTFGYGESLKTVELHVLTEVEMP